MGVSFRKRRIKQSGSRRNSNSWHSGKRPEYLPLGDGSYEFTRIFYKPDVGKVDDVEISIF